MKRVRILEVITAALIAGSLAACSSAKSGTSATQGAAAGATQVATSAPTATATATAPASTPSAPSTQTVGALLGKFSSGPITVDHMPTADPAWLARVQTEPSTPGGYPKVTDPKLLNLMALVDEAAREKDTQALTRLCSGDCDPAKQLPLWQKPGALDTLSILIEQTHRTEGDLFPGFILAGSGAAFTNADDTADGKALGATSARDYVANHGGLATSFSSGTGGADLPPEHWTGLKVWGPYPAS